MNDWKRPAEVAMPTVWTRFRGQRAMADGRVPNFWVQCVRPEDDDVVIDIMVKNFLREEETSRALNVLQDKDNVAEFRSMWKTLLEQRVSLAAWTSWPDGTPRLVGCNVLYVRTKNDAKLDPKSPTIRKVFRSLMTLDDKVDLFERHGVTEYLSAMGLSTKPEYRGQALGMELLLARVPLCRALGLRVTGTIFTGIASQKQAARAGFKKLAELRYAEYVDEGQIVYASVKGVEAMELKELVVPERD